MLDVDRIGHCPADGYKYATELKCDVIKKWQNQVAILRRLKDNLIKISDVVLPKYDGKVYSKRLINSIDKLFAKDTYISRWACETRNVRVEEGTMYSPYPSVYLITRYANMPWFVIRIGVDNVDNKIINAERTQVYIGETYVKVLNTIADIENKIRNYDKLAERARDISQSIREAAAMPWEITKCFYNMENLQ